MRALLLSLPLFAAVGCGISTPVTSITQPEVSNGLQGKLYGGQQPIVGTKVSVYAMSTSGYGATATLLGTPVFTNANGGFSYGAYTCPANNPPVYILGQGGDAGSGVNNAIALVAGIGNCNTAASVFANINEVTTAATAFALKSFFNRSVSTGADSFGGTATQAEGNNIGMVNANLYTVPLLVSISTGVANGNTATVTLETAKLNSIANSIAACINSSSSSSSNCQTLFSNTSLPDGTQPPTDTLQAAVRIATYPYQNVANIYNLGTPASPFVGLSTKPNDFTLAASYTAPTLGLAITGNATSSSSSTIDIDATGRVWFPSNKTTAHGIAYFDPSTTTFSSLYATALVNPQYVAIDNAASPRVYGTDLSGNTMIAVSTTAPSAAGIATYTLAGATSLGPVAISNNASTSNGVLFAGQTSTGAAFYEVDAANATPAFQAVFTRDAHRYRPVHA